MAFPSSEGSRPSSNTFQMRDEVLSVGYFRVPTTKGITQEPPHGIHDTGD